MELTLEYMVKNSNLIVRKFILIENAFYTLLLNVAYKQTGHKGLCWHFFFYITSILDF